jgi:hypothetical protein
LSRISARCASAVIEGCEWDEGTRGGIAASRAGACMGIAQCAGAIQPLDVRLAES